MRRWVAVTVVGSVAWALAGCGGGDSTPPVANCYSGSGMTQQGEHLVATLRLHADGKQVTGTYVAGATAGQGLAYDVKGTLDGGKFTGTFTAAGQAVEATGTVDASQVVLDSGRGFAITRFTAGC